MAHLEVQLNSALQRVTALTGDFDIAAGGHKGVHKIYADLILVIVLIEPDMFPGLLTERAEASIRIVPMPSLIFGNDGNRARDKLKGEERPSRVTTISFNNSAAWVGLLPPKSTRRDWY